MNKETVIYDQFFEGEMPEAHVDIEEHDFNDVLSPPLKQNVIVMGDIIEDTTMARLSEHKTVLNIGFFN